MSLDILIVGAGVAGPALAAFLRRSSVDYNIDIIERAPSLRLNGAQIDVKSHGISILKRMGLARKVKACAVEESGLAMVDRLGNRLLTLGVTAADKQGFTLTSEYEIMRGDLVKILFEETMTQRGHSENAETGRSVKYHFDVAITDLVQSETKVIVTFSTSETRAFDLVVAADGQRSRTRDLAFGPAFSQAAFRTLGINTAYYTMPRLAEEGTLAKAHVTRHRFLLTRTGQRPVTGAYIFTTQDPSRLTKSYREPVEAQKEVWADVLKGSGWQEKRFVEGLVASDDFFAHEQGQVKAPTLHTGRVVLLGDAGYCPSPFTGLGTTLAISGAYVLAGELTKHGTDIPAALAAYAHGIQPLVDECQKLPTNIIRSILPSTSWALWLLNFSMRFISVSGLDKLINWWMASDGAMAGHEWNMPQYSQFRLDSE